MIWVLHLSTQTQPDYAFQIIKIPLGSVLVFMFFGWLVIM